MIGSKAMIDKQHAYFMTYDSWLGTSSVLLRCRWTAVVLVAT